MKPGLLVRRQFIRLFNIVTLVELRVRAIWTESDVTSTRTEVYESRRLKCENRNAIKKVAATQFATDERDYVTTQQISLFKYFVFTSKRK